MDPEESSELLERSSLGSVGARSLRDRITRDEAEDVLRTASVAASAQDEVQRHPDSTAADGPTVAVKLARNRAPKSRPKPSQEPSPGFSPTAGEPTKMIQSVQRALRIMEYVGDHPLGVSAPRIAFECGLNRATAYNLLRTLVYEHYLRRDENGRYTLGLEVSDRYSELTRAIAGPKTVTEHMSRFSVETGYSTVLARFVEGRPAVTDAIEGQRVPQVEELIVGFDGGAHATAPGKALLGTLQPSERMRFLQSAGMRAFTRRTLIEPDSLEYDLAVYGESGLYAEMGQFKDGLGSAAVLVDHNAASGDAVAFGVMLPLEDIRTHWTVITQRLREVARELV